VVSIVTFDECADERGFSGASTVAWVLGVYEIVVSQEMPRVSAITSKEIVVADINNHRLQCFQR
jgi:uncharacterized protein with GYD domain